MQLSLLGGCKRAEDLPCTHGFSDTIPHAGKPPGAVSALSIDDDGTGNGSLQGANITCRHAPHLHSA